MSVAEGQLLAGKYRVERVLGRGGMGVVVAAHHIVLDEQVAIKFLLPEALHSSEAVLRFEREARAAVKIKSEHVARVTDVGRLETGAPYMVMELLRGRDLGALLEQSGPLPLEAVADYVLQAGEAIAEAHGLGIVHRDLKPPNLFLTLRADGSSCVKVLDFGISKVTGLASSSEQGMTATTAVMGSPLYMSPEQLMSARDVDMRTDIWALGVICYELLTGHLPFRADTLPQLCMAISIAPPTPLRTYRPDLPVALENLLLRCLEKDRARRVATMAELAAELVEYAPSQARLSAERIQRLARVAGFSTATLARPSAASGEVPVASRAKSQTVAEFGRTGSDAPSHKLGLALILVTVLAGGVVAAVALLRGSPVQHISRDMGVVTGSPQPSTPAATVVPTPPAVIAPTAQPAATLAQIEPPAGTTPAALSTAAPRSSLSPHAKPIVSVRPPSKGPAEVPDCDIPYFFDSRGNRVFKKGCL